MQNLKLFLAAKAYLLILFFLFIGFLPVQAYKDAVTIAGSTTIMPISEKWAKMFKSRTGINVSVHGGGSTGGIKATKIGTADIGASSRELTKNEKANLKQFVIGKDALAVIVNKSNPISNLTFDQIRGIFVRKIKNWNEVGGLNKTIQVVNRESGSGTRSIFEEVIMQIMLQDKTKKTIPVSLDSVVNNSNAEVKETVKLIPNAIGYVSIGYVDSSVKVLKVESVYPAYESIYSGEYQLVRSLYYLVKENQRSKVQKFIEYILSKEAQDIVEDEGFLPIISFKENTNEQ